MSGILVVDDDQAVAEFCCQLFAEAGHRTEAVHSGEAAIAALKRRPFEIVVSDVSMPGLSGLELLKAVKSQPSSPDMILITGFGSVPDAVAAVKSGAFDYIEKPVEPERLLEAVSTLSELRKKRAGGHRDAFGIAGASPATRALQQWIAQVAPRSQPVLITGEPGTGKELVARAIHQESTRRHLQFVAVNCAAVAGTCKETELFGQVRGATPGTPVNQTGALESAGAGTVFLDDLDQLPAETQTKLFRALQERQFRSLGSGRLRRFEGRIVAASSANMEQAVAEGRFRPELYYRLNVLSIELPPLRARREDIPGLVSHFLTKHGDSQAREVTPDAMAVLQAYSWPGNVRELENTIVGMMAHSPAPLLTADQLPAALKEPSGRDPLQEAERVALIQVMRETRGQVGEAAAKLGVSQATLYRKIASHRLRAQDYRG